jgi:hypothetical protein
MSVEEIKAIVRRFVDEPWNKGNLSAIDELCDPSYTLGGLGGTDLVDREAYKQIAADVRAASPDHHAMVDEIIVEGDRVAFSWMMQGTFEGNPGTMRGITILHLVNGKIVQDRAVNTGIPK